MAERNSRLKNTAYAAATAMTVLFSMPGQIASAQENEAVVPAVMPDPADVASIDAIIAAIYDVISGPAGEVRDWDRFHALFVDGARLIPRTPQSADGVTVFSPEDYVARVSDAFLQDGFFEKEIGRRTEQYGDIAHVLSAYESKRRADDVEPFARGVNSFQLLRHNGSWRIVSIFWQGETEDNPIPTELLHKQ